MIEARQLDKYFSKRPVVKDVCFTIRPEDIVRYLGPNGAGKSILMVRTLLKSLAAQGKAILYGSHVLEIVEKI